MLDARAALELNKEHMRRMGRVLVTLQHADFFTKGTWRHNTKAFQQRLDQEAKWDEVIRRLLANFHERLDIHGAATYAALGWHRPAAKRLAATLLRKDAPEWQPPSQAEVQARLIAEINMAVMAAQGLQAYIGLAGATGTVAGQTALERMGLDTTFAFSGPRNMAQDLYALRGSKVIQELYGQHLERLTQIILSATNPANPIPIQQVVAQIKAEWPQLQTWQAARIARTETAAVWTTTSANAYQANGITSYESTIATGPTIGIDSEDPCTDCIAMAEMVHSIEDDLPPWHPNCRCEAVPILRDEESGEVWLPPDEPWAGGGTAEAPEGGMGEPLFPAPLPGSPRTPMALDERGVPTADAHPVEPYLAEPRAVDEPAIQNVATRIEVGDTVTVDEAKAALTSTNNKISGVKTQMKRATSQGDNIRLGELDSRLTQLQQDKDTLKEYIASQKRQGNTGTPRAPRTPRAAAPPPPPVEPTVQLRYGTQATGSYRQVEIDIRNHFSEHSIPDDTLVRFSPHQTFYGNYAPENDWAAFMHNGVLVRIELDQGQTLTSYEVTAKQEKVLREMSRIPKEAKSAENLQHVELVLGTSPDEAYWGQQYKMANFKIAAQGGQGGVIHWRGGFGADVFQHEVGHVIGREGGPLDLTEWKQAMNKDMGTSRQYGSYPAAFNYKARGGMDAISDYGSQAMKGSGTLNEDWADTWSIYMSNPEQFAKVYPERMKLLDEWIFGKEKAVEVVEETAYMRDTARVKQIGNQLSGLRTRLKNTDDFYKRLDIQERIDRLTSERTGLKDRIAGRTPIAEPTAKALHDARVAVLRRRARFGR